MKCKDCDNLKCEFNPKSNDCYEPCFHCKNYQICVVDMQGYDDCVRDNCRFEKQ